MPILSFFFSVRLAKTELYDSRTKLRTATRIANPGCYATSMQLLLAPLLPLLDPARPPTVFGISGYSGAGTVSHTDPDGLVHVAPKVPASDLLEGIRPYALTDHIHEREAGFRLGVRGMAFVPSVGGWFSGITSVASVPLAPGRKVSAREIKGLYEAMYKDERMVEMWSTEVLPKGVAGRHGWVFAGLQVHSAGDRVVVMVRCSAVIGSCCLN